MGWLKNLLASIPDKTERRGARLVWAGHHEIEGPESFSQLFRALDGWLGEGSILYFEDGVSSPDVEAFLKAYAVPEQLHIALGTLWPRPRVFHVPASGDVLTRLAKLMENHGDLELAIHFHVYRDGAVLLEWHDVFSSNQPVLLAATVPEADVRALAARFQAEVEADARVPAPPR